MKYIKKCKKGSIFDAITLIIMPMVFVFILLAFFFIYTQTSDSLTDTAIDINTISFNQSIQPIQHNADSYASFWDTLAIFLIFGMWLIIVAISFILGNNPVFLVFYIIASFGLIVTSLVFQVVFNTITENIALQEFFLAMPKLTFFVSNFFPFALFFILSVAVALYLKPS